MGIFEKIKKSGVLELIQDPRLIDLVTKREFRIGQEELRRELMTQTEGDEALQELSVTISEGFLVLAGKVRKRPIPFAIPFSARFTLHSMEFSPRNKTVHLRLEELKPIGFDSLTKKIVEKIPFLTFADGLVTVHLAHVPRLSGLLGCQVKGFRPFDHIVVKDLFFREGEITGKVGVLL